MSTKVLLALSGILNLVLIANFVTSVNQTLDYKSGGAAKEIIEPIKIHTLDDEIKGGWSDLQIEILGYGEIKYKQSQQQPHASNKYWQAGNLSSKATFLSNRLLDEKKIRAVLLERFGESAVQNPVFKDAFYPLSNHADFLTSAHQIALNEQRVQEQISRLEKPADQAQITNPSNQTVAGVNRLHANDVSGIIGKQAAFEYNLRHSYLSDKLRLSGVDFTEAEFRGTYEIMATSFSTINEGHISSQALIVQRNELKETLGDEAALRVLASLDVRFNRLDRLAQQNDLTEEQILFVYEVISQSEMEMVEAYELRKINPERSAQLMRDASLNKQQQLYSYLGEDLAKSVTREFNKPIAGSRAPAGIILRK